MPQTPPAESAAQLAITLCCLVHVHFTPPFLSTPPFRKSWIRPCTECLQMFLHNLSQALNLSMYFTSKSLHQCGIFGPNFQLFRDCATYMCIPACTLSGQARKQGFLLFTTKHTCTCTNPHSCRETEAMRTTKTVRARKNEGFPQSFTSYLTTCRSMVTLGSLAQFVNLKCLCTIR